MGTKVRGQGMALPTRAAAEPTLLLQLCSLTLPGPAYLKLPQAEPAPHCPSAVSLSRGDAPLTWGHCLGAFLRASVSAFVKPSSHALGRSPALLSVPSAGAFFLT